MLPSNTSKNSKTQFYFKVFSSYTFSNIFIEIMNFPLSRIRTIFQSQIGNEYFMGELIKKIIKHEGLGGFWRGYMANSLGISIQNLANLFIFVNAVDLISIDPAVAMLGSLWFTSIFLFPLETAVRRYQADSVIERPEYLYKNFRQAVSGILRSEGYRGFYKGFGVHGILQSFSLIGFYAFYKAFYFSQLILAN